MFKDLTTKDYIDFKIWAKNSDPALVVRARDDKHVPKFDYTNVFKYNQAISQNRNGRSLFHLGDEWIRTHLHNPLPITELAIIKRSMTAHQIAAATAALRAFAMDHYILRSTLFAHNMFDAHHNTSGTSDFLYDQIMTGSVWAKKQILLKLIYYISNSTTSMNHYTGKLSWCRGWKSDINKTILSLIEFIPYTGLDKWAERAYFKLNQTEFTTNDYKKMMPLKETLEAWGQKWILI